jgi:release factor glutamine methyltransferase
VKRPNDITKMDWTILTAKYGDLDWLIKKLESDYPVQYLIGYVDFLDSKIKVNKNVLIPRFETEYFVEKSMFYIDKLNLEKASVLDVGTGSGCISIVLKKEFPGLEITAIDVSTSAIRVAKQNAKLNKCRINFIKKNMFKYNLVNKYQVLISNPPYILEGDMVEPKTKYEPYRAIYGGMEHYEQLFDIADKSLCEKYLIALEIHEDKGKDIVCLAKKRFPQAKISLEKDLTKRDRYIFIFNE